jgi:integrase
LTEGKTPKEPFRRIRLDKLSEEVGHKIVSDIQPNDLRNFRAKLEKKGLSDSYIDDVIVAGKTVINRAFENGMVSIDTYRRWKSVKKVLSVGDNARDRCVTVEEHDKLQEAKAHDYLKGIELHLYWTGLRENDVLALTLDRVDLQNRIIRFEVKRRRTQKPKPAEIYIADELFEWYLNQKTIRPVSEDNHVIQYRGKRIKEFKTSLKTWFAEAGIPYGHKTKNGITPHDFRHTCITDMRRAGVDILVNKVWHGHSTRDAHSGYHTIDRDDLKQAGELLQDYRNRLREEAKQEASNQDENVNHL